MTSTEFVDFLYRKLPQVYRDEDQKIGFPLRRYLEALTDGGFAGAIKDIEGIMTLIDPDKIPDRFLPYLCASFGLPYFPDLDTTYQRKFLSNVGEILKRRGTYAGVQYFIKSMTGFNSRLEYSDSHDAEGNYLVIYITAESLSDFDKIEVSMKAISDYIGTQIPYFITPIILEHIDARSIDAEPDYKGFVVSSFRGYKIAVSGPSPLPLGKFILDYSTLS